MEEYTIEVTAEDIARGVQRSAAACPISRAADRVFPNKLCLTNSHELHIMSRDVVEVCTPASPNLCELYKMPPKASKFVRDFDHGLPVEPITFVVRKVS